MSSLKFGTSGLRGLVTDLVGTSTFRYSLAFLRSVELHDGSKKTLLIGRDLRASSAGIAQTVAQAAETAGFEPIDCGALPTPALALEAMRRQAPAIMVTGSHIPDDRNGLKFYRADGGEITKADESAILTAFPGTSAPVAGGSRDVSPASSDALERYRRRYIDAFASDALAGLTVAVYEQSTVARDVLCDVLSALGARVLRVGRSEVFIPIDTEAHRPEDVAVIQETAAEQTFDALVTADGDADRPLIADARGHILRGDIIGVMTARFIGAQTVVVPVTANSAIERTGGFAHVVRTRVGSPHVIAGMAAAEKDGDVVVGFEANGGFLLGSDVALHGRLTALPTRDALLPIIATLAAARRHKLSVAEVVASLGGMETASDRLEHIASERSATLLEKMADDSFLRYFLEPVGALISSSRIDGLRINLDGSRVIHFRPSGNAPELRCYAEAESGEEAARLVQWGLGRAKTMLD